MKFKNGFKVSFILAGAMVSIAWADTLYFENVASSLGVADTGSGNSATWIDYDNDGDLDIYFVNDPGSGGFYHNNLKETGSATFTSVSVGVTGNGNHLVKADYDGDGNMDVLVGRSGNAILYRNKGDGTFEEVTAFSGISVTNSTLSVWGNYFDQHGKPDLYFGQVGKLYKNNGGGTFTDTTDVLPSTPPSATPAWIDYDNDGYDDLFLAPFSGDLILYHNKGDGTFEDVSTAAVLDLPSQNARIAVGDYDNNGYDDIYFFGGGGNNYLFANNGNGTFSEVAFASGVQTTAGTGNYGVNFLDFDLDGDLDLFANGGRYGSNNFFLNNSNGTFTDITALTGLSNTDDTHDIAVGDFNGDGYPDIYEINFTGHGSSANKLFLNTLYEPTEPPVADAGLDQTVEQESYEGTEVTLDGSGSTDADSTPGTNDDIVSFDWYEGPTLFGSGEQLKHTFQLGEHTVTLIVTDSSGQTDDDEVVIVVEDSTPPTVYSVSANPDVLWPPNHKMVEVTVEVDFEDICDPDSFCYILGVSSNEPINGPGDGNTEPDWEYTDDPLVVLLRAERSGGDDGRIYTIHIECKDVSGNTTIEEVEVTVPHDKDKGKKK